MHTTENAPTALVHAETGIGLEIAKRRGVCRICGLPIGLQVDPEYPQELDKMAGKEVVTGPKKSVTLNYGEEYSHTDCLIGTRVDDPR